MKSVPETYDQQALLVRVHKGTLRPSRQYIFTTKEPSLLLPPFDQIQGQKAEVLMIETVSIKVTGNSAPKKKPTFNFRPDNLKYGGK
jgi:hypothetical protein